MEWDPNIIVFCCNWCSYGGADTAGTGRMQYSHNVRVIRVMCSGRINPLLVLKAFDDGADGVMVAGCHFGDCHYDSGNFACNRRMTVLKTVLGTLGIEEGRFFLDWISASEGEKFANAMKKITEEVKKLGPFSWNKDK
ncbi:MAG: hydrogenase iron-sulfur subunit [Methanobacteriaceae archaeon]